MIKGLIPDKYTMKQVQEQTEISDELKNNVRTMLFKYKYVNIYMPLFIQKIK